MAGLKLPEGPIEALGDKISRAGVIAAPDKRLEAMGLVAMEYAKTRADAAYVAGMREAATIAATMAERPYDTEPEFSAMLHVEHAIMAAARERANANRVS
jgi:hypothetical protein